MITNKETKKYIEQNKKRKTSLFFSYYLQKYRQEALPLLHKSTQQSYEFHFRYLTEGPLSYIKMKNLTAHSIYVWIDWLKKHPTAQNNGRQTFANELRALSAILNWYRNFVNESFTIPITKRHKQLCYYKRVPFKRPDYYARPEELRVWIQWLQDNRKPVYWKLATFMVLTGARVSEACGMLWDAVDLNQGIARVIRKIRWDHNTREPYLENITKTKASTRLLLLSSELVSLLENMNRETKNREFLFVNKKGEPLKYNAVQHAFNTGFKTLNLPWRSTHILRHSYATMALRATKDLPSVQATLGHKSIKMTERYAKVIALLDTDVAEKTTKAFNLFNGQIAM